QRLKRQLRDSPEHMVPWVGAGLSIPYGYPTWSGFLRGIAATLAPPNDSTANGIIDAGFLDIAADFLAEFYSVDLEREMIARFSKPPLILQETNPLRKLGVRTIVTTNYDRVVETMMPWLIPLTPVNYGHEAFRKKHALLKVHGTIEQPDTWILTRTQYAQR